MPGDGTLGGFAGEAADAFVRIWSAATEPGPAPSQGVVLVSLLIAVGVVGLTPAWRIARHLVTIAHEGAHGVAALLTGRRLKGIRLHSDTSGLTVSRGRPDGAGMVVTLFAGYTGPALIGLGTSFLIARGYPLGALWILVALLGILLLQIRNWFGLWSVLASATALALVSWYAPPGLSAGVSLAIGWFLLLGSVRPVFEVQAHRRRDRSGRSDPDQLARITRVPALLWIGAFLLVNVGSLLLGGLWLFGWSR